jgi:choline dehydrogenase-like flavoprotein
VINALSCDVLIVGSGAAGATLAATLAESTSLSIILLEKGGYYGAEFFNQRELDMTALLADNGARTTVDGAIPVAGGQCVGGGTTVNYALSFDPIPGVWEMWRKEYGLQGFSFDRAAADYGVRGLSLASAVRDVRRRCNIHAPDDGEINENNRLFARGCHRLGVATQRFELNMRGCIGCGFCGQGCSYDAKLGTMLTYLPDALERGVRLVHDCTVDTIGFEASARGPRAVSVNATIGETGRGSKPNNVAPGPIQIDAKLIILSAGAIETPALLQRSKVPDPFDILGRGLILHPSLPIAGVFDRTVKNYRGITGCYYSDHFYAKKGFMLECLFDHPIDAAIALPGFGAEHFDLMRDYTKLAGFGAMLVDSVSANNRVTWNAQDERVDIAYQLSDPDKERLRYAAERMVEIMFAAGAAQAVLSSDEPINGRDGARFRSAREASACRNLEFVPNQTLVSSAHAQASVKMSEDASQGAIDSRGEFRGVQGLVVCDSSAFPTSCGANPMVAVMSMARYQGKRIAAEWKRYQR